MATLPLQTITIANTIPDLVTRVAEVVEILNALAVEDSTLFANNADYLAGQAASFYLNANNINAGTLANTRLSGTYDINITGSANTALLANNSTFAYGKTEGALNVNSAATAVSASSATVANNATYAYGKVESALNVNSAATSLLSNNSTYAFGKLESALNVNSAVSANNTTYAYGKVESALNVNSAATATTANNATYAYGKTEGNLNVNSATTALTANNSTYAYGKTEGNLNVNSATSTLTSNNSTYFGGQLPAYYRDASNINAGTLAGARMFVANSTVNGAISTTAQTIAGDKTFTGVISGNGVSITSVNAVALGGKTEGQLNVNSATSALTSNNSTYAYGKTEGALNVNSASTANNSTYAYGKTEGNLNVNSATTSLTSNNSTYLGGQLPAYYRDATNINAGTLAGARMFVANATVNGALSTTTQTIAGVKTFSANTIVGANTLFVDATLARVGVNTAPGAYALDVKGDVNYTGILYINGSPATFGSTNVAASFLKLDDISSGFDGTAVAFNLTSSASAVAPHTAQNLFISLNGVWQEPTSAYTVSTSTITFTQAPLPGTKFFGTLIGQSVDVGNITPGVNINPHDITATGNVGIGGDLTVTGTINGTAFNAITANDSVHFGGQLPAYYTNATNISTGTLAGARMFVANSTVNGAISTDTQTIAGVKTFSANLAIGGSVSITGATNGVGLTLSGADRIIKVINSGTTQFSAASLVLSSVEVTSGNEEWHIVAEKAQANAATGGSVFHLRKRNSAQTLALTPITVDVNNNVILVGGYSTGAVTYGNVGVGATPHASYKLDVSGAFRSTNVTATGSITGATFSGNGATITSVNAIALGGKTEGQLNVNSAATATTANNSTFAYGKAESALNVNSATTALTSNNSTYFGGQLPAYYRDASNINAGTLAGTRMFVANSTVNGALSTAAQTIAGDKTFTNNVAVSGVISGNGVSVTSVNAIALGGKTEGQLNVNSATTALTANNSTYAYGKTEGNLNVNSATTALTSNNSAYLGGQLPAYYQNADNINAGTLAGARMFVANSTVNGALSTTTQTISGVKTFTNNVAISGVISGNGVSVTSVNAVALNGKTESGLNVNSAVTATTANNSTYAYGKTEGNLNVNSATSAITANNSTYAYGKVESALNANSALTSNNSTYFGGQLPAYYTNADNISSGTLAGARMFVANTTVNGALSTTTQTIAGIKTFSANTIVGANTLFVETSLARVGVNTAPGAYALDVKGDVNYTGTLFINGSPATFGSTNVAASFLKLDDISSAFDGTTVTFNLTSAAAAVAPHTAQNLFISLNGVWQEPTSAYTISTTTITFSQAPLPGTKFFGTLIGQSVDVGNITPGVDINPNDIVATGNVQIGGDLTVTGTINGTAFDALTANDSVHFGGQLPAYYTNASNIATGTLAGARMFVANSTVNGAISTADQSFAGVKTFSANAVFSANLSVSGIISGNGVSVTSVNAVALGGKTEGQLNANAATYLNGQLASYYQNADNINAGTLAGTRMFVANATVNGALSTTTQTIAGVKTFSANAVFSANLTVSGIISGNGYSITSVQSALNANNSTYFDGQASSYYRNADNVNAGTLAGARMFVANSTVNGAISTASQTIAGDKTFTNNVAVSGVISGNGVSITSVNAVALGGKTESGLNVNSATTALTANNSTYFGGQLPAYYRDASNINAGTLAGARMFVANSTVNGALSTAAQTIAGDKTFTNNVAVSGVISGNGVSVTSVNAIALNGKTEGQLNANAATYLNGKTEGNLNVNSATTALTSNNSTYFDGQLPAYYRNADNINAGTLAGARMFVANSTVNGAISTTTQSLAGDKTFTNNVAVSGVISGNGVSITSVNAIALGGKTESGLNVNSATSATNANNAAYLGGQLPAYYQNADNINAGTLAGARMFVANATVNGALSTAAQTIAGAKTFSANAIFSANLSVSGIISGNGVSVTSVNAIALNGKTESGLNVNSATSALSANNSTYLGGQLPAYYQNADNINAGTLAGARMFVANATVNGALSTTTQTIAGVKTFSSNAVFSANLSVSGIISGNGFSITSIQTANNATFAYGKTEGALNANAATYLNGKTEGNLNVNNAVNLNGQASSYYTNADNISSGTLAGARMFVANTTVNGAISTTTQSFAGVKTFTANTIVGANTLFVESVLARVGVNTAPGAYALDVAGDINYTGTLLINGSPVSFGGNTAAAFVKLDDISSGFNGVTTAFSITVGAATRSPHTAQNLIISLNGVIQEPIESYTVSGSTLTFSQAPLAGTKFFGTLIGQAIDVGTITPGIDIEPRNVTASGNVTVSGIISGNGVSITSVNAVALGGKTESGLNVNSATTALTANNSTYAYGKTEGNLNVNSATTALTSNNSTYFGGQLPAYYRDASNINAGTLAGAYMFVANSTVNGAVSTAAQTIAGAKTFSANAVFSANLAVSGIISGNGVSITSVNAIALNGKTEGGLNANAATYLNGKTEGNLNVNSAATALTANNSTYAYGKTEGNLNVNSATTALTSNNSTYFGGQLPAYYTNATNLATGTVPTARLGTGTANGTTFLAGDQTWKSVAEASVPAANTTTNGVVTIVSQSFAGVKTFTANTVFDAKTQFPVGVNAPLITGVSGGNFLEMTSTGTGATTWIQYLTTSGELSLYNGGDRLKVGSTGQITVSNTVNFNTGAYARYYRTDAARYSDWGHSNDGSYINNSAAGDNFEFKAAGSRVAFFDGTGKLYERSRTAQPVGGWLPYSVSLANMTTQAGTLSSLSVSNYRYMRVGSTVFVKLWFNVTLSGAASDYITMELPVTISSTPSIQFGVGMGNVGGNWGAFAAWYCIAGDTKVRIYRQDLSTDHAISTLHFALDFNYEAAS